MIDARWIIDVVDFVAVVVVAVVVDDDDADVLFPKVDVVELGLVLIDGVDG